jgi:hypothetical protein
VDEIHSIFLCFVSFQTKTEIEKKPCILAHARGGPRSLVCAFNDQARHHKKLNRLSHGYDSLPYLLRAFHSLGAREARC